MARSSSEDTTTESYAMSDGVDLEGSSRGSSRFRADNYEDEDDYYFNYVQDGGPRRQSSFMQMLDFVGMNGRGRRRGGYGRSQPSGEALHGLLARPSTRRRPHRESRSCRKGFVMGTLRRTLLVLPFVILMLFGVLHIVQSVFGSAELLWDYDDDDLFLPDWGRPGAIGSGLAQYPTDATRDVLPIACHSHNDYWRRIPLLEAVHWGCTSVEADVWLFDDDLFVGHATTALTRPRTLRSLYINPLIELLDSMNTPDNFANGTRNGIFDEDPTQPIVLLIDLKSEPYSTFRLLEAQLEPLRAKDYLTYHDGNKLVQRAVTVVGTGNTPFDLVKSSTTSNRREIFFDAPLDLFWEVPASPIVPSDPNDKRPNEMTYATAMIRAPANESTSLVLTRPDVEAGTTDQGYIGVDPSATADDFDTSNSYYASTSFSKSIGFVWRGHLSPRQMEIMRGQIRGAKRRGLKVRYWDTPTWPVSARNHIWQVLVDEGADVLNVDDLKGAATEDWRRRVHRWWS